MDNNEKFLEENAQILKALAHPVRLTIIKTLMESKCNVSNLESLVGLSQSGVSQHLRVLRLSGIIEPEREGKEVCYSICNEKAKKIVRCLLSEE